MLLPLLLGLLLTSQARAACSDPAAKASLDEDRLLGTWHNLRQTGVEAAARCLRTEYSRAAADHLAGLVAWYNTTSAAYSSLRLHMHKAVAGSADGQYEVHREDHQASYNGKLHIIDTDYDNYAVVWMCGTNPRSENTKEWYFLNTRQQHPSAEVLEQANRVLPAGDYSTTDQTDCPAYEH
ncbi:lazarillo protein-like [Bacillus rossius redtenbacheri]|uniref:lazarillo protein-like n=1 Tax=Bacillus rossius redtenbacheri TaxID=93214 RepID=UPI002FDCAEFD